MECSKAISPNHKAFQSRAFKAPRKPFAGGGMRWVLVFSLLLLHRSSHAEAGEKFFSLSPPALQAKSKWISFSRKGSRFLESASAFRAKTGGREKTKVLSLLDLTAAPPKQGKNSAFSNKIRIIAAAGGGSGAGNPDKEPMIPLILHAKDLKTLQSIIQQEKQRKFLSALCEKQKERSQIPSACYQLRPFSESLDQHCLQIPLKNLQISSIKKALSLKNISARCRKRLQRSLKILNYRKSKKQKKSGRTGVFLL